MTDDNCYMVILYKVCINNGPGMTAEQLTAQIFKMSQTDFQSAENNLLTKGKLKFGVLHNCLLQNVEKLNRKLLCTGLQRQYGTIYITNNNISNNSTSSHPVYYVRNNRHGRFKVILKGLGHEIEFKYFDKNGCFQI